MVDRLGVEDAKKLQELLHQAYQGDEKLGIHFGATTVSYQGVIEHLKSTPTFAVKDGQQIIATVSVRLPWSNNPGPYALPHLGWVATNPAYQRQGKAKELIDWVIQEYVAKDLKAAAVSLGTALEHPWLRKAYQKLGFDEVETVRKFPDHQTVYLVKVLDEARYVKAKSIVSKNH